jgi:PmbA protein
VDVDPRELDRLQQLIDAVKRAGADQADAYYEWGRETEVTARDGAVERLKQAVSQGVGLRVFRDHRLGFAYTSDLSADGLTRLADKALALAAATTPDPFHGLPDRSLLATAPRAAAMFDPQVEALTAETLVAKALTLEKTARAADPRVLTVQEAGGGAYVQRVALANSEGFAGNYEKTYAWLFAEVVAEEKGEKQSESYTDQATHWRDLADPEWIAQQAVRRVVRLLGARKIASTELPVIFEPDVTKGFIRGLLDAFNGDLIYKKSSFLLDKLGATVASPLVTLLDDGGLDHRTGSRPFDGEGVATQRRALVDKGVLRQFLYDTYTANKAGAKSTGTASRGYASLPEIGSSNLFLQPGDTPATELYRGLDRALVVTSLMGFGVNVVTGDYSRGAQGLFIENGAPAYPVQEVTVAGNLLAMLRDVDRVGADMDWRGRIGAPSIRFARLTVAGR